MRLKYKIVLALLSVVASLSFLVYIRSVFPRPIERALDGLRVWWLGVAKKIVHVQTIVILSLVYFTGIAVTALIARCMRQDFLRLKISAGWHRRKKRERDTIERLSRQF